MFDTAKLILLNLNSKYFWSHSHSRPFFTIYSPANRIPQIAAGVFKQVKHKLETLRTLIIRVWHVVIAGSQGKECRHRDYLLLPLDIRSHTTQVKDIGGIHTDYEVKVSEILPAYLTATVGKLISPPSCMNTHPIVGKRAYVVSACTGRVKLPLLAGLRQILPRHTNNIFISFFPLSLSTAALTLESSISIFIS